MAENTTRIINFIKQKFDGISFPERLNFSEPMPGWFLGVKTDTYVTNLIQNQEGEGKTNFFIYECNNTDDGARQHTPNPIPISKICLYFKENPAIEPICFSIESLFTSQYTYPFEPTYNYLVNFYKSDEGDGEGNFLQASINGTFNLYENINSNVSGDNHERFRNEIRTMNLECTIHEDELSIESAIVSGIKKHSKGKRTNKGKGKRTNKGKGKRTNKGKGKKNNKGKGKRTNKGKGKKNNKGKGKSKSRN
jgi:hypothetical protein